jgi:hypothetical protein
MLRRRLAQEQGIGMVLVVLIGAMLTLLSVILIEQVRGESNRSVHQVYGGTSYQAAEAGIDDYVSKLVDDRLYYLHYVHPGEATRQESGGTNVAAGAAWTFGQAWTYPNGKDAWRALPNGYEYNLRVYPPDATSQYVRVVAAGRRSGETLDVRVLEVWVRPSSLADYYRVVNGDVGWAAGAITNGKIYANGDIDHDGIATANIYAEGQITGSVVMQSPGGGEPVPQRYDVDSVPDIRSQIKNPIDFTSFLTSFTDIERASQLAGGINLPYDASKAAYRLSFKSNGTIDIETCVQSGLSDVADVLPVCAFYANRVVPPNGAVYAYQDVIVQNAPSGGGVKGRFTVASNDDIIVADNITYVTPGEDVLGLVAKNDLYVAKYTPDPLTWSAGVIAQTGTWKARSWNTPCPCPPNDANAKKSLMTFRGMAATDDGGSFAGMFTNRDYGYDANFLWLPPPWFPVVEDAYTVLFFRELPAAT